MKHLTNILTLILICSGLNAQQIDTFVLHHPISKYDTIVYKRLIRFDKEKKLYHVEDYFENGQIQMKGMYSSFDKTIKENYWCNYKTNTKEGLYQTWHRNGNPECKYNFVGGRQQGLCEEYYSNGQISDRGNWVALDSLSNTKGVRHGNYRGWSKDGKLIYNFNYEYGLKMNPIDTTYKYLTYTPTDYYDDTLTKYPLIIYLHGGSHRGSDRNKLYGYGVPREYKKGREFPFVIISPQCPTLIRWSTDNWFDNLYSEIKDKFRIDTNRVYLTGVSLGGSGTWYLAIKYPELFAAIAPMCGFTSHMNYIEKNINNLVDMPIWAFHGAIDKTVPVEETDRIINKLEFKNTNLKYSRRDNIGHWIVWLVYPEEELYDWFLKHDKRLINKE